MSDDLERLKARISDAGLDAADAMNEAIARIEALTAERERLALAICGGEDAPGYANAQTIETLERVAKQNQQSHGATINSLLVAEADNARLRDALQKLACECSSNCDWERDDICPSWIARAALNAGKEPT
jgi:hypothetical protein